eukprot:PITA_34016
MFDAVAVVGPAYKAPTFAELRGPLLQDEKTDCTARLAEFRASLEHTECTVMSDGWTDQKAGKMLMERYPYLFWTPCAAHCIDFMLEDIGKIPTVRDIVESSKSITKFIYNHSSALSLMRRFTNNKELVRPAITRFATTFISLQSLLNSMWEVKSMFLSADWRSLSISHKPEGEGICRLVSYD